MDIPRCYGCMKHKTQPICEHCGFDESVQNAPHQLPTGTVLKEQYLIGKVLGQGGFGITYLGWDLFLDLPVAIKEYYPNGAVMREVSVSLEVASMSGDVGVRFRNNKERFMREAKMLARFSQVQEIVQVRNFFLANNTAYIVMEYVEGVDLKHYIREHGGKLSVDETFAILRPVLEALGKVHKAGLVHRDISPDNIMMLPNGRAKLLDFGAVRDVGAAKPDGSLTSSTEAILKQGYAPIEQYQSRGSLGPWTDVYALCATIWYCLTGEVPPDAPGRMLGDMDDLPWRKQVPALTPEQIKALNHGMALRSTDRTASIEALCDELFAVPEPDPIPIPEPEPEPEPDPVPEPMALWKKFAVAGLVLVLLTVAIFPIWYINKRGQEGTLPTVGADNAFDESQPSKPPQSNGDALLTAQQTHSGDCGHNATWTLNINTGKLVISGSGEMYNYAHPDSGSAGEIAPWYDLRMAIEEVQFSDAITQIGDYAFTNCERIQSVHLPAQVKRIGIEAFFGTLLTEIDLPEGLEVIDGSFGNTQLSVVVLPESLVHLGAGSFAGCPELEMVRVGQNTQFNYDIWFNWIFSDENGAVPEDFLLRCYANTMAEDYARIAGCRVNCIGESVWDAEGRCGESLFYYFDRETGFLKIDGQGEMWDFNAYYRAEEGGWVDGWDVPPWDSFRDEIRILSLGDEVTGIGECAFAACSQLQDLWLGNVQRIGAQAFEGCIIDELYLPHSLTEIEPFAFNWCGNLYWVMLPENLEVLHDAAFNACFGLREFFVGPDTVIGDGSQWTPFNHEGEQRMPHQLVLISERYGTDAERFANQFGYDYRPGINGAAAQAEGQCGDEVYWYLAGDTLVLYGSGETWFYRMNVGEVFEYRPQHTIQSGNPDFYIYHNDIHNIIIMPGVTHLGYKLFCDMPNLRSVDFGTVVSARNTFDYCGIEEVYLPDTLEQVGEWLFVNCENLRKVTIENGSDYVGEGMFAWCTALDEVWFGGQENIGDNNLFDPMSDTTISEYSDHVTFYVKAASDALRYAVEHDIPFEIYH